MDKIVIQDLILEACTCMQVMADEISRAVKEDMGAGGDNEVKTEDGEGGHDGR